MFIRVIVLLCECVCVCAFIICVCVYAPLGKVQMQVVHQGVPIYVVIVMCVQCVHQCTLVYTLICTSMYQIVFCVCVCSMCTSLHPIGFCLCVVCEPVCTSM